MSALFCDLVGFTAASERADPEDVRARIRPYHERLRLEIERYGGTVEKFVGDAVMVAFGAPVAHEDDAERAVRAGLRILEAIEELNEADPGLDLQVRVGINTGEAVVALGARTTRVRGWSRATSSTRLPVSRVRRRWAGSRVGEQTYRATSRVFEYEQLEPVVVKGKAEPVVMWQATAARARFGTDVSRQYTTPLVGRELEKPLLIGTFERAAQQRSVQLVTVLGEPGVGKSRLVAELVRLPVDEARVDPVAAGALPALWRGDHVLGAGRDRQGGGGHSRLRPGRRGDGQVGRGCLPGGAGAAVARAAAGAAGRRRGGLVGGAGGVVHGLAALPAKGWLRPVRACSCSRTCTGPTRRCSRSSSIWPSGPKACRCSSSARPGRSSTRSIQVGPAGCATRRRSTCRRSRIGRRPSSSPTSSPPSSAKSSSEQCSSGRAVTRSMRRSSCACSPIAASSGREKSWQSRSCRRACRR